MPRSSWWKGLSGLRFPVAVLCVAAALGALVDGSVAAFRTLNVAQHNDAWRSPIQRLVHTGDVNDIPHDLQEAAMSSIPPRSTFALLLPVDVAAAEAKYGLSVYGFESAPPYFRYLLLPSRLVDATASPQYVICFGCDTSTWDARTNWVWSNGNGEAVGQVTGP